MLLIVVVILKEFSAAVRPAAVRTLFKFVQGAGTEDQEKQRATVILLRLTE
jgi:hypothetical protein